MAEIWKEIPGFSDYEASNLGNVRSWRNNSNGKNLKPSNHRDGYKLLILYDNKNSRKSHLVHRLVMKAFSGESNLMVNHKDGIKNNNKLENLEYCTRSQNMKHAFSLGLKSNKGQNHPKSILKDDDILLIRKLKKEYNVKQNTIASIFDVSKITISHIIRRRTWRHI